MLDGIFNVLTAIGDFIGSCVNAVLGFIDDIVQFAVSLGEIGSQVGSILGGFPVFFVSGIATLIGIMVLLRVVGRD